MNPEKTRQLNQVAHVMYLNEFRKVQKILAEEARLRQELERLRVQTETSRREISGNQPMQSIGADLQWQAWLTRMQQQLNTELSLVIARKLTAIESVKTVLGRQNAVQSLHNTQVGNRQRKIRSKQQLDLIHAHLHSNHLV